MAPNKTLSLHPTPARPPATSKPHFDISQSKSTWYHSGGFSFQICWCCNWKFHAGAQPQDHPLRPHPLQRSLPMFLQLDTIVECYLITIPSSSPSIPLHCCIMLSKMRHLWTSDDGFLRRRHLQPFAPFGSPDCHRLRSRVELHRQTTLQMKSLLWQRKSLETFATL